MEKHILNAQKRTVTGRKVKKLRSSGLLPANIYGKKIKSIAVTVPSKDFTTVFAKAGETGLIELVIDDKKHPVLIHNVQYHPVTSEPLHVDLFEVDLKEKVSAKVPLEFIGDSPAVSDKVGVLLTNISEIEVEALPADLPEKLEVDVSGLVVINQSIKVNELKTSDKVKILTDHNLEIVKVAPLVSKEAEQMAKEEAEAAAAAATATAETTVPAEGAAAPIEEKKATQSQPPKDTK